MFRIALTLCAATFLLAQSNPNFNGVQSVYIMPMSGGYHQHLANRLIRLGLFNVVTDPQRADTILSDRLGEGLELRLDAFDATTKQMHDAEARKADDEASAAHGDSRVTLAQRPVTTSLSGGKGTLFLVDRKSRRVLWSIFERPKNITPKELDKSAGRVAGQLQHDWSGKKS